MSSTMGGITMACVQQETKVLTSYTLKGHYNFNSQVIQELIIFIQSMICMG